MRRKRNRAVPGILLAATAVFALIGTLGCDLTGSSSDNDFSGSWVGKVCGRDLDLRIHQSGTTLTGTYTLSNPTFSEPFEGTASSRSAPASATLHARGGRRFEITFHTNNRLSGTFFNPGPVCDVHAVK